METIKMCAWCSKKEADEMIAKGIPVSHGICEKCAKKYMN